MPKEEDPAAAPEIAAPAAEPEAGAVMAESAARRSLRSSKGPLAGGLPYSGRPVEGKPSFLLLLYYLFQAIYTCVTETSLP